MKSALFKPHHDKAHPKARHRRNRRQIRIAEVNQPAVAVARPNRRSGFNHSPIRVTTVADKMPMGQALLRIFKFPL